jgi:response regulator RpfG family c-di-GMP phosphodiesterase
MLVALKLLVVDDDGPTLKLMRKVLTSVKAEVRALRDGEQAVQLLLPMRLKVHRWRSDCWCPSTLPPVRETSSSI